MKLQIEVEGIPYDVDVQIVDTPVTKAIVPLAPAPLSPSAALAASRKRRKLRASKEENVCRSPMCGVVVSVDVNPGQFVEEDDPVLVLEAMKMETAIRAPRAGHIKAIHVRPGDLVVSDQLMVEITDLTAEPGVVE